MQIGVYLVLLALEARLRKWKRFFFSCVGAPQIVVMVPGVPSGDHAWKLGIRIVMTFIVRK